MDVCLRCSPGFPSRRCSDADLQNRSRDGTDMKNCTHQVARFWDDAAVSCISVSQYPRFHCFRRASVAQKTRKTIIFRERELIGVRWRQLWSEE
jgi:hypothetical protein